MPSQTGKLRWGILGTGNIAGQFTKGLAHCSRGIATAVASRKAETAREFAASHNIPRSYGSYDALLADPDIDAIYVSFPNHLHAPWTIKSLEAGKHVLCEKPLAMNAEEAEQMFAVSRKTRKLLVEAFMYRSHPQTLAVVKAVQSGIIGEVLLIRSSFCYRTRNIEGNVRFVREWGGGGLMDIGCYCINFARFIAGAEPTKVHATAHFHPTGVDDLVAADLEFPGGVLSSFTCAMSIHSDNTAFICGTEGYIEIPVPWKAMPGDSRFIITAGIRPKMDRQPASAPPPREVRTVHFDGDMYGIEADDFAATLFDGKPPIITPEDSIGNMSVIDEIRRQIGLKFD